MMIRASVQTARWTSLFKKFSTLRVEKKKKKLGKILVIEIRDIIDIKILTHICFKNIQNVPTIFSIMYIENVPVLCLTHLFPDAT